MAAGIVALAAIAIGVGAWGQGSGGRFSPADVTSATNIAYPVNTTVTGMVSLLLSLDGSGNVQNTQTVQDIPPLTAAAQESVQKWKFKPAMANGKSVGANFSVNVVFNPYNPGGTSVVGGGLTVPSAVPSNQGDFMPPQIRLASYAFYPPDTLAQGTVVLSVSVDKSGHVSRVKVVHGVQPLSDAAVGAVKQWGFQPAMHGGEAVAGKICVAFVFQRNLS
jgi:TonB family protein